MDLSLRDLIDWLIHTGEHYPDIAAIILSMASAWCVALLYEAYVVPHSIPIDVQKLTLVFGIIFWQIGLGVPLWNVMDPADKLELRLVVLIAISPVSVVAYVTIGKLATRRWPWIASVWNVEMPK